MRGKEDHYRMIYGPNLQEDITTLNVYSTNVRVLKYIRRKNLIELKQEIDKFHDYS